MIRATVRFLFFSSFVFLIGLLFWMYLTARNWQEVAASAQEAQNRATKLAKIAFNRADRCVGEIYSPEQAEAEPAKEAKDKPGKDAKTKPGKPATSSSPRKSGAS